MVCAQRGYCDTPQEALERWGPEEEFSALNEEKEGEGDGKNPTEGQLWDLWYGVLHAAKRIPWADETAQQKLVALVQALKGSSQPSPARQHD